MKNTDNHLVIMAGGIGSRFWPLSSEERPKQFLDVLGCGKTLIQLTVERFEDMVPAENIWVVTSGQYAALVAEQLPGIPSSNILLEPCRRNTAPCIAYASWRIKKINSKANIVVTPSDHVVMQPDVFRQRISEALDFSSETDAIVTLGIKPSRPETGYGYIKGDMAYSSTRRRSIFRVEAFKEKPDLETAETYIQDPSYLWNSGIFIWRVSTIVNAFRVYQPAMAKIFEDLLPVFNTPQEQEAINKAFPTCETISVDYAILEHAEEIFVIPSDFGWSDLGTWNSLRQNLQQDKYGNACIGQDVKLFDCHDSIVRTESLKQVVVQGCDGFVIAENEGTLLICRLSEEQRIKLFH